MWRKLSLAFALVNAACTSDLDLRLGFEAQSAIIVTVDDNRESSAWGLEDGVYQHSHPSVGTIRIYVLQYLSPLSDLGLSEGEIAVSPLSAGGIALPAAERLILQTIVDGNASAPEALNELPPGVAGLRLSAGSVSECVDGGGCLVPRTGDSALICNTPCQAPELPALPEPPAAVELGPCAPGWVSVPPGGPDDIMECVPWAEALECEPGSAQRPGEACTVVGAACPPGAWPVDLEPGAVYFVDPAAGQGGDGSQPAPYTSVDQVPLSTTATTVIALAKGIHSISTAFTSPVVLQGACALETQISTRLEFSGGQAVLRDLGLAGLRVSGAQVRLQGAIFAVADSGRIEVSSGGLRADDLVVSGSRRFGLSLSGTGWAHISRARFEGLGIQAEGQTQLELRASAVVGGPKGLVLDGGAKAQLSAVAFEANTEAGFLVRGEGTELDADQVVGRGGESSGAVLNGGKLTGRRLAFMGHASYGLVAAAGGVVDLQDLLVRDTIAGAEGLRMGALQVLDESNVTVLRAHVVRCIGYGLYVSSSVANFNDLTVTDVVGLVGTPHKWGFGLRAVRASHVELIRARTRRVHGVGLSFETSVEMTGSDVEVLEMLGRDEDGSYGRGIEVIDGSHLDLERVRVHAATNVAVQVRSLGSNLDLRDLTITGTGRSECFDYDCTLGGAAGLIARESAAARVDRFVIDANANYGVRVADQAWLELRNGRISNHPIGAEVLVGTFDLSLLTRGIQYVDNTQNLRLFDR